MKPETETDASFEICGDADRAETVCRQIIRRIRWTDGVCRLIRRQIGEAHQHQIQLLSGHQVLFRYRQKISTKPMNLLKVRVVRYYKQNSSLGKVSSRRESENHSKDTICKYGEDGSKRASSPLACAGHSPFP